MNDKIFVDSNVVVYVFDKNLSKKKMAIDIIKHKPIKIKMYYNLHSKPNNKYDIAKQK